MNRRLRRALAKQAGFPPSVASQEVPRRRVLSNLFYWRRVGWPVYAHVFSHCRRFFNEWAGAPRAIVGTLNHPGGRVVGLCPDCQSRAQQGATS